MFTHLHQWLTVADPGQFNFRRGYLTGVVVTALLVLAVKLVLVILFGERGRAPGVMIRNEHGSLFITAAAIIDLARAICLDYPRLELGKAVLRKDRGENLVLELTLDAEGVEGDFTALAGEVQQRILAELKEHFGIAAIRRVDLRLRHLLPAHG